MRDDLERRDFTVNAMARDIRSGVWIDPFGGRDDLARRRAAGRAPVGVPRRPAARSCAASRAAARDGLVPEPETLALMRAEAPRIAELSAERVRETLDQTLSGSGAADALRLARDVGALAVALPEWQACVGVRPALGDAGLHGRRAHPARARRRRCSATPRSCCGSRRSGTTSGKPFAARAAAATPRRARVSRDRALRRLAYDNDTRLAVVHLVREHPYDEESRADAARARGASSRASAATAAPDLLLLRRCDRLGRGFPPPAGRTRRVATASSSSSRPSGGSPSTRGELAVTRRRPAGRGRARGPALGRVLARLLAAVVDDPSQNTRDDLLRLRTRGWR